MTKRIHVSLPVQYLERLRIEAELSGLSLSEIIRKAIDLYLSKENT